MEIDVSPQPTIRDCESLSRGDDSKRGGPAGAAGDASCDLPSCDEGGALEPGATLDRCRASLERLVDVSTPPRPLGTRARHRNLGGVSPFPPSLWPLPSGLYLAVAVVTLIPSSSWRTLFPLC